MTVLRRLVFTDLVNNNNKFYQLEEDNGNYFTRYGRIGSNGVVSKTSRSEGELTLSRKLEKGYVEIELHVPKVVVTSNPSTQEERFIDYVFRASGQNISGYMSKATVDALSQNQIDRGRIFLGEFRKHGVNIKQLSRYYQIIPTDIGNAKREQDYWKEQERLQRIVNSFDLAEEEERLNQLEAAIATQVIQQSGELSIPGLTIIHMDKARSEKVHKILLGQQKHSHAGKRMFGKPVNIYEVKIKEERESYQSNQTANVNIMFHGSKSGNLLHILRSGLRKPTYAANGWRLGPGIYFAKDPLRAYQYSRSFEGLDYLLMCEVKLGREFEEPGEKSYNTPPAGYHSVRGTKSFSGIDEWTVYDQSQQTIRAVIEFKG